MSRSRLASTSRFLCAALALAACAQGTTADLGDGTPGATAGAAGFGGAGAGGAAGAGQAGAGGAGQAGAGGKAGDAGTGGDAGAAGAAGSGGDAGAAGTAGSAGDAGSAGAAGSTGGAGAGGGAGNAGSAGTSGASGTAGVAGGAGAGGGAGNAGAGGAGASGGGGASGSGGFTTCATGTAKADAKTRPVDIIWVVDNSISMKPAVDEVTKGLNAFAASIGQKTLDYKVIMLSLRGTGPMTITGKTKYPVCVPEPLAGPSCANAARFFQSSIDIRSIQPLEQLLGTLGQTKGYSVANSPDPVKDNRGGEAWKDQLRKDATKSFVVVTDDNARLLPDQFLHFAGGTNPYSSSFELPPGILDPFWDGLFESWVFHALYGWGSDTDPAVKCTYAGGSTPPASGTTYTSLVAQSKGKRAKICDLASAWAPFLDAVAESVAQSSKIACEVPVPPDPSGTTLVDPQKVNVAFTSPLGSTQLFQVDGPSGATPCDPTKGGWYYDDPKTPTKILLCPASCDAANAIVGAGKPGQIEVTFGCNTVKPLGSPEGGFPSSAASARGACAPRTPTQAAGARRTAPA